MYIYNWCELCRKEGCLKLLERINIMCKIYCCYLHLLKACLYELNKFLRK